MYLNCLGLFCCKDIGPPNTDIIKSSKRINKNNPFAIFVSQEYVLTVCSPDSAVGVLFLSFFFSFIIGYKSPHCRIIR